MRKTYLYQVNITRDCNLRCTHCYIHSDVKKASGKMAPQNFRKIFADIGEHMSQIGYDHAEIHVIGGEPTILGLPFFEENIPPARAAIEEAASRMDKPFSFEIIMVSNLLSRDILPIAKFFDRINTSYEPETRFPKPKLEQMWRDNLALLKDNGLDVGVTTAMTKHVVERGAASLLDFHYDQGIKQIHFGFFIPSGDGLVNRDEMFPEFVETSNFLIEAAHWYFERRDDDPDLFVNPVESMLSGITSGEPLDDIVCPIIAGSMDIDWNGQTATCLEAGGGLNPEWLGNVVQSSVAEVAKSPGFRAHVLEAAKPKKECRTCDEYRVCRSGCGVIFKYWNPEVDEDCPGFKKFIKFMRHSHDENGIRPRYEEYRGKVAF
ncbi:MAG: radical SAM protein [Alphaproteobacteria bacterium]|nr:radical SAM protein [Alphaproteobacteria bacterium SS10]